MKNLKKLTNPNTSKEEIEEIIEELIDQKFETDRVKRYQKILKDQYGIDRKENFKNKKTRNLKWIIFVIFIAITLLIGSLIFFQQKNKEAKPYEAQQYVLANPVQHLDLYRGQEVISNLSLQAALEFENEDFTKAVEIYHSIERLSKNDLFYYSYCLMRIGKFQEAKDNFKKFTSKTLPEEPLYAEGRVFEIINLILMDNIDEAKENYDLLKGDSWEQKQIKPLIN